MRGARPGEVKERKAPRAVENAPKEKTPTSFHSKMSVRSAHFHVKQFRYAIYRVAVFYLPPYAERPPRSLNKDLAQLVRAFWGVTPRAPQRR